jgi:hypothetical protein
MPNPGKSNRNYAHTPTDAQRITLGKYATAQDFARASEGLRAMLAHGMSFADIGRHCHMPRGSNGLYRQILTGTAKGMSPTNAARLIDGYDRFRARPPVVVPPNKVHIPTDASRAFSFSPRTKRGNRTAPKPPKANQRPAPIPSEYEYPETPPQPMSAETRLRAKLKERRQAERGGRAA